MKLRIVVELEGLEGGAAVNAVAVAINRYAHGVLYLGALPGGISLLWNEGKIIGRAWCEDDVMGMADERSA
jgi:hypothetical protein